MASWGGLPWSEGKANRVRSRTVKSPNKTSAIIYSVMELIDIVLRKLYVKIMQLQFFETCVETVSMTGSKKIKNIYMLN